MPGSAFTAACSRRAIASVTSFSRVPLRPSAPGSWPPWPASIATTMSRPFTSAAASRLTGALASIARGLTAAAPAASTSVEPGAVAARADDAGGISTTSRGPDAPSGPTVKLRIGRAASRSSTRRWRPPACGPERTALTGPCPSGNALRWANSALSMSMTMRSGLSPANTSNSVGAVSSTTSRVPSGPDQRRTSVIFAGAAVQAGAPNSSAANASSNAEILAGRAGMRRNLPRGPM